MKAIGLKKMASFLISKRVVMFLFFLLIAFIVWFANCLSNDYRVSLELQVRLYSSTNPQMTPMSSTETLSVLAKANGFYIIQNRLKPPTVYVDIKNQKLRGTKTERYMLVSSLKNDITQLLSDDMQIESFSSDTLYFRNIDKTKVHLEGTVYGGDPVLENDK